MYTKYLADNRDDDLEIFRHVFQLFDFRESGFITTSDLMEIMVNYLGQDKDNIHDQLTKIKQES